MGAGVATQTLVMQAQAGRVRQESGGPNVRNPLCPLRLSTQEIRQGGPIFGLQSRL